MDVSETLASEIKLSAVESVQPYTEYVQVHGAATSCRLVLAEMSEAACMHGYVRAPIDIEVQAQSDSESLGTELLESGREEFCHPCRLLAWCAKRGFGTCAHTCVEIACAGVVAVEGGHGHSLVLYDADGAEGHSGRCARQRQCTQPPDVQQFALRNARDVLQQFFLFFPARLQIFFFPRLGPWGCPGARVRVLQWPRTRRVCAENCHTL
jgi:hypothetical protein